MSDYTMSDVKEADRLWDEMPIGEVSAQTGISEKTLSEWSQMGLIDSEVDRAGPHERHDAQTVSRADELYDRMPLRDVADLIDVPESTLEYWSKKGWITSEVDWRARNSGRDQAASPKRAAELYYAEELNQYEIAERLGVHQTTVSKYLKKYRNGDL